MVAVPSLSQKRARIRNTQCAVQPTFWDSEGTQIRHHACSAVDQLDGPTACAGEGPMKPFYDYHLSGGVHCLRRRTAHCCLDWDNNQVEGSMSSCGHEERAVKTRSNCLAARSRTAHNSRPIAASEKVFA
jgi:hypothetical protein